MSQPVDILAEFPLLQVGNYTVTSPKDAKYNCIAWAAGFRDRWWWPISPPGGQAYWPPNAPRELTVDAFVKAYKSVGFQPCSDGSLLAGIEKVAIYANNGRPTHAARQLPNGRWTSKLGKHVDMEHAPAGLNGSSYGIVVQYLSRPLQAKVTKGKKKHKKR